MRGQKECSESGGVREHGLIGRMLRLSTEISTEVVGKYTVLRCVKAGFD